jgi:hypothetical protein
MQDLHITMGDGGVERDLLEDSTYPGGGAFFTVILLRKRRLVVLWHGICESYQTLVWTYVCKGWHNISCAMAALV